MTRAAIITLSDNPLLLTYATCAVVLCVKMLLMATLTARQRVKKGAFSSPEDVGSAKAKVRVDEDVERVRRAHLNDLENIPVFLFVSLLYISIGQLSVLPSVYLGKLLLWSFTIARIIHTFVYAIVVIPQPARGLSFGVGLMITMYMAISTLIRITSI